MKLGKLGFACGYDSRQVAMAQDPDALADVISLSIGQSM